MLVSLQWNDDFFHKMERIHGEEAMRQVAASHEGAVAFIEKVVRQESIDCDFG